MDKLKALQYFIAAAEAGSFARAAFASRPAVASTWTAVAPC